MIEVVEQAKPFLAAHVIFARYFLFAVIAGLADLVLQEQGW
jgi:hypothetical protein